MDQNRPSVAEAMRAVEILLAHVGEDTGRAGLIETPKRVIFGMAELLSGYRQSPEKIMKTFDDVSSDEMVVVSNIIFTSFCEHHWLPFVGVAHVGYLPNNRVIGLSKIPRIVDMFARRLQVQERMTNQIVDTLMNYLEPKGCGCLIESQHMCCAARGIKSTASMMTTSALRGVFKTEQTAKFEFMNIIGRSKK